MLRQRSLQVRDLPFHLQPQPRSGEHPVKECQLKIRSDPGFNRRHSIGPIKFGQNIPCQLPYFQIPTLGSLDETRQ